MSGVIRTGVDVREGLAALDKLEQRSKITAKRVVNVAKQSYDTILLAL